MCRHSHTHTHSQLHTHTFSGQSFNLGASYVALFSPLPGALRDFLGKLTAVVALIYRDKRMCVSVSRCVCVRVVYVCVLYNKHCCCSCYAFCCCCSCCCLVIVGRVIVACWGSICVFLGLSRAGEEGGGAKQMYTAFGSTLSVCPAHKHMQIDFGLN